MNKSKIVKTCLRVMGFTFISLTISACASSKKNQNDYIYDDEVYEEDYENNSAIAAPVATDDFLDDFDPVTLQSIMVLNKAGKKLKVKEISKIYLVPRSNSVEITFRDLANEISIIWNKTERNKIIEACNLFLTQYEERSVPHQKVNPRTAYFNSKCSLWYGVLNADNGCSKNDYYLNCEFIDKKPYLLFKFSPTRCDKLDQFTPKVSFYMSPSQIREFLEIIDQENLEAQLQTKRARAYTY